MNQERRVKPEHIIMPGLTGILLVLLFFMIDLVSNLQGTARVVNYAGRARGVTQRMIKMEIAGVESPELEAELDQIMEALQSGSKEMNIVRLDDENYQKKLASQATYWEALKAEIKLVRSQGAELTNILSMSEEYFHMADDTANAAEKYSERLAVRLRSLEFMLIAVILCIVAMMIRETAKAVRFARANKALSEKAYIDLHTGLPNKSRCEELINDDNIVSAPTSIIMIDMNYLKTVNDSQGHMAGDAMIKEFASILRGSIPEKHFVGRYGGDEFIVILENVSQTELQQMLDAIEKGVREYNLSADHVKRPGVCMSYAYGIASSEKAAGCTVGKLLKTADYNMYQRKQKQHRQDEQRQNEYSQKR